MYNERIDQVSEDLLKEIDEKDQDLKTTTTEGSKKSKGVKQVVKANKKVDKLKEGKDFYLIIL